MDWGLALTGRTLSHYLVLDRIGEGAMGLVYKAEDTRLGRFVALKFLNRAGDGSSPASSPSSSNRPDALQRFWREARAASALNHPGICTIYAIDEYDGRPFIAMELLEGRTLREIITCTSPAPLKADEIVDLGIQIADALDAAHSQGIIHRDIKPANLFVTARGQVKILDFGLAKRASRAHGPAGNVESAGHPTNRNDSSAESPTITLGEVEVTTPGSIVGTMAYMSPEQARAEELDLRTDLFSLASVLYEMATGRRAFPGRTLAEVGSAILKEDPPPALEINPQLPPALSSILQKGLAKNREYRYQTAAEIREDLQWVRQGSVAPAPGRLIPSSGSASASTAIAGRITPQIQGSAATPIRSPRRRTWLFAVVGAVLLAAFILVITPGFRGPLIGMMSRTTGLHERPVSGNVSLAILPFRGAENDAGLQAFGNGLAEALTGRLSQLTANRSFQVTPASEIKDKKVATLGEARQEFGTTVGLDFSVERSEALVRVTYTLIDARTRRGVGGDTVTVPDSDLLALEDRLEESIVRSLGIELRPEEQRSMVAHARETLAPQSYSYYLQGAGYLQESYKPENVESALTVLREALKLDPQFGLAQAALGEAYWGKYENTQNRQWIEPAREACSQAVKMGNAGAEGHECLGLIANGSGEYAAAAEQFQMAAQLDPTSDRAYSGLASAYQNLNQPAQAEATYRRAISLRPQYWRGYSMLGAFYSAEQEFDKAHEMFSKAVELAPDSYRAYANLGAMDLALDRRTDAIQALQRSIAIRPNEQAYSNLATTYFYLGNYDNAARNYRQALGTDATDYTLWGNLADAEFYGGHREEAVKSYLKAASLAEDSLKVNSADNQTLSCLAGYYSMVGDRRRALEALDRARAAGQPNQGLFFSEALVYNQLGDTDVALEWLAKALAAGLPTSLLRDAPALNNLHDNPRYRQLLEQH